MDTTSSRMLPQATPAGASGISKKEQERPKTAAHNAFYVKPRFLAAKTGRWRQTGRLYRVLGRFDTQGGAFTA